VPTAEAAIPASRMQPNYPNIWSRYSTRSYLSPGNEPRIRSEINVVAMEKLNTLLIANRGEIAVRIIKTAK
jgi:hypothetical protein